MTTNITDNRRAVFAALTSRAYDNFALFSCGACPHEGGGGRAAGHSDRGG